MKDCSVKLENYKSDVSNVTKKLEGLMKNFSEQKMNNESL